METISERIIQLDPTLTMVDEGKWSNTITDYSAFNDAGVECEVGEFLYSMVRLLKPEYVLETGTHVGIGASYMGLALKDNGGGRLDTFEFIPEIYEKALARTEKLGLTKYVYNHLKDVQNVSAPSFRLQMILLDTEPQTRFAELLKFYDSLDEGGYVFIHDLHRHMGQMPNNEHGFAWPWGLVPNKLKELVKKDKLRPFHFPTPRGLTGFYKTREDDYKW